MPWPFIASGTVSIDADATVAIGTDTFWSPAANQMNYLSIPGIGSTTVDDVTDDTHLAIPAWQGDPVVNAPYRLVQFPKSSLQATKDMRDFLAAVAAQGIPYIVPAGEEPNDAIGDDGWQAVRKDPLPVVWWLRVDGHYEFQGNFTGLAARDEPWNDVTNYNANDVVPDRGILYLAKRSNINKPPRSSPDDWLVYLEGGRKQVMPLNAPGRPRPGEAFEWLFDAPASFATGMPECILRFRTPVTADMVCPLQRDGVTFGTATVTAGNTAFTFDSVETTIGTDGIFAVVMPLTLDATAADLIGTFVAYR